MNLADIDLLDLDRWARDGAPHDWFSTLRDQAPVWRHRTDPGDPGFWVVSGYDDVVALGRCPHAMASGIEHGGVSGLGPGDELQACEDAIATETGLTSMGDAAAMLLTMDPPEHTTYRKIVNRGFTPRMIAALEGRVRAIVRSKLDAVSTEETFDFTTSVAVPIPMQVISEMIGAPDATHGDLQRWGNQIVASTDDEYRGDAPGGSPLEAVFAMFETFEGIRQQPDGGSGQTEPLSRILLEADIDGQHLTPIRFKMFLLLLTIAGNETTRNAMSHAVLELARHPDQWKLLRDDPSLIPGAVEEVLRYASPVLYFRRNAVESMQVSGQSIEPGDLVSLWYVSANRDERRFDDPQRFDVRRSPNTHVTFGGGGAHFCLGASLARLEVRVLLEELVERYHRIELDGPVSRLRSNFLNGIKHLPVRMQSQSHVPGR